MATAITVYLKKLARERGYGQETSTRVRRDKTTNLKAGTVYLVAIVDLYSRKVPSWRLSNSMDSGFCEEALQEVLEKYGCPAIFNTDYTEENTMLKDIRTTYKL